MPLVNVKVPAETLDADLYAEIYGERPPTSSWRTSPTVARVGGDVLTVATTHGEPRVG